MSERIYTGAMTQIDHWSNEKHRCSFLAEQLKSGCLSLVLGAGVSVAFKLPDWNKLIVHMEELMSKKCPPTITGNMEKAEWLKEQCNDEAEYIEFVRQALYKDGKAFDMSSMSTNTTLNAIYSLSSNSKRGAVKNILTFNFDNILEIYLKHYGRVVSTHANGNKYNEESDVNIYHMHGYLPNPNTKEECSKHIIFDKKSYDDVKDYTFWEWYPKVADLLRTNTCIFIGLSGEDENMDRFLKDTKKNHANIETGDLYWGVSFLRDPKPDILEKWEEWGIYPIVITDFSQIPGQLFDITRRLNQ